MKKDNNQDNGRVLGHLLSREDLAYVSGGGLGENTEAIATDAWVDSGTCTPTSDADVAGSCPVSDG